MDVVAASCRDLLWGEVSSVGVECVGFRGLSSADGVEGDGELERVGSECQNHGIDTTPCYAV